jgi:hypothetical protein
MTKDTESEPIHVSDVFVPGRLPEFTYVDRQPRDPETGTEVDLELAVKDYLDERGAILTVHGPTKTGKTVLLERVVQNPIRLEGQNIRSEDAMWTRIGDQIGVWTDLAEANTEGSADRRGATAGATMIFSAKVGEETESSSDSSSSRSASRSIDSAVRAALTDDRAIIIDDFHFISRPIQRELVRALKPLVTRGVPVILVSISHRFTDVISAEPDMTGRVRGLGIPFWDGADLLAIAREGFKKLRLFDPSDLASMLQRECYGSPHLMQQFCRELVKADGIRHRSATDPVRAIEPPKNFEDFFRSQADAASKNWFDRLFRGPKERGKPRALWSLGERGSFDTYGLALAAIVDLGAPEAVTKDVIDSRIACLVEEKAPAPNQTTRSLSHMSRIAKKRVMDSWPDEEELDEEEEDPMGLPDTQPVMEFVEETVHLADPFFAFSLRWAGRDWLDKVAR